MIFVCESLSISSARVSVGLQQVISPLFAWLSSSLVMLEDTRGARGLILYTIRIYLILVGCCIYGGGVTFMRAFSSLIPSTCFIACLLFAWTNFHVSFAIAAR